MKYGYTCECGWRLGRGPARLNVRNEPTYSLTRQQYAAAKEQHAKTCNELRDELKRSGKTVAALETAVAE